jgi:hypothetical protein
VPSDLEQMPNLRNFIRDNGTLDTNHHAVLISHTANDIVTTRSLAPSTWPPRSASRAE